MMVKFENITLNIFNYSCCKSFSLKFWEYQNIHIKQIFMQFKMYCTDQFTLMAYLVKKYTGGFGDIAKIIITNM